MPIWKNLYSKKYLKQFIKLKILVDKGQFIFVGPLRDNKLDFNRILENATNRKIPPLMEVQDLIVKSLKK